MSTDSMVLGSAPIIEAVVDIDCDMPPNPDIDALDAAAMGALADRYPISRQRLLSEHVISGGETGSLAVTSRQGLHALQYLAADEKQIIQWRPNGFSFNRLAPYGSLDDYLPEIERNWKVFVDLAKPVICRTARLRYINRLLLPLNDGRVDLEAYLTVTPRLADEGRFVVGGFFSQQSMRDTVTASQVNVVLAAQPQAADDKLPILFDIEVFQTISCEPDDWPTLSGKIQELRVLKNVVFRQSLTDQCLTLFQP
jgi:uncharacterized protein (TIGR04255 family)